MADLKLTGSSAGLKLGSTPAQLTLSGDSATIELGGGAGADLVLAGDDGGANLGTTPVPTDDLVAGALVHRQRTEAAVWNGVHPFGRMPDVTTYVAGEEVDTDVHATTTTYSITWPEPTAGTAIIR